MEGYQILKQIGKGSYGEIWLVKCSKTKKKYVLKQFDLHHLSRREQRSAYQEAKLLSTLKHPNIVTYLDSFYDSKGNLFIVMGYCELGDLHTCITNRKGKHFEEKQTINWFIQICMALKYLHNKNILHRDLKTKNIFLTRNKLIKVGDLGIARVLKEESEMATTVIGTPYYMSPEILSGQPYNQKSDVWALGCCLYEMVTLERAFSARDIDVLILKVINKKVLFVPEIYSPEVRNIISSTLDLDPERRPNVNELLLNDFIRKYILLFLQESPSKCHLKSSHTKKLTSRLSPSNKLSVNCEQDTELEFMRKTKDSYEYRNTPDSNGNGDSNDNSQYGVLSDKKLVNIQTTESKKNLGRFMNNNNIQVQNQKFAINESNNADTYKINCPSKLKSSASLPNLNVQKLKSENSFRFLTNLTDTIKQCRLENMQSADQFLSNLSRHHFFYGPSPPKSADEVCLHATPKEAPKRNISSAHCKFERDQTQSSLPHLSSSEVQRAISNAVAHTVNLPLIKDSKMGHSGDCENGIFQFDSNSKKECFTILESLKPCESVQHPPIRKSLLCASKLVQNAEFSSDGEYASEKKL